VAVHARAVAERLETASVELPAAQVEALAAYLDLLVRWNKVYNLTGLRDPGELIDRHLLESLALEPLLVGDSIADVGSGAGLPGIPLAIVEPQRRFTLIESRAKRVRFLRHVAADLRLANVAVAHGRAEHLRPDKPFATVLARAVAPPPELLEICRPLTAPGSRLLLLTAAHLRDVFSGLARDFVVVPAESPLLEAAAAAAPPGRPRSTIVALERTDV
jgi:16S rRNA (guanine527-N7)-methyltransferase